MLRDKLHPGIKLMIFLLFVFTISLLKVIPVLLALLFLAILTARTVLGGEFREYILKFLIPVPLLTFFIGFPAMFNFVLPGDAVLKLTDMLYITEEGIRVFLRFFLRTTTIVATAGIYVKTHTEGEWIRAILYLKLPHEIVFIFSIVIKYIKIFMKELNDFIIARKIRWLKKRGPYDEVRWTALRSGFIFMKAMKSARETNMGLILRFAGERVQFFEPEKAYFRDFAALLIFLSAAVIIFISDRLLQ